MPDILLRSGAVIVCDDEDYDYVTSRKWRTWDNGKNYVVACYQEFSFGREFRVLLHRAIGARISEEGRARPERMKVTSLNGDYLDVRRENLGIYVRKVSGKPKIEGRPIGWRRRKVKQFNPSEPSGLWAGGLVPVRESRYVNRTILVPGGR